MVFTPAEQVIPAKARVGPDDDRDLRPALPNPADDPFQFLHRSRGPIDIGTPQPGAQQMLPREDVQREITVVAVVTVKEPAFLLAMDRVVGRIQIQHDLLGRRFVATGGSRSCCVGDRRFHLHAKHRFECTDARVEFRLGAMHAAMEVIQLPHQIQLIPLLALLSSFVTPWVVVLASSLF